MHPPEELKLFIKCNAKSARTITASTGEGGKDDPVKTHKISIAPGETKNVEKEVLIAAMDKNVVLQAWFDNGDLVKVKGPAPAADSKSGKDGKDGKGKGADGKSKND